MAAQNDEAAIDFFKPEREAQVINRFKSANQGPLSDYEVGRLIREVMSACLALEQPLKIAYLGARRYFYAKCGFKTLRSFSFYYTDEQHSRCLQFGRFRAYRLWSGASRENSTEGVINHTLDMFINSALKICGEVEIRVHHHLANLSQDLSGVKHIYSHQQSFAQCRRWLDQNMPGIGRITVSSNGEAGAASEV